MTDSSTSPRGLRAAQRVNQFRLSVQLFHRNYLELKSFVEYMAFPRVAIKLGSVDNRWRQYEAMREVMFLLHNYVAAAQSLVDHSRRLYEKFYKENNLIHGYPDVIESRFSSDPLSQFVKGLRQIYQHYRLENICLVNTFKKGCDGNNTFESRLKFNKTSLMEYLKWNNKAKEYLAQASETIDVGEVVDSYFSHVIQFQQWFMSEQENLHGDIPELVRHIATHGLQSPVPTILRDLDKNLSKLEGRDPGAIKFSDLEEALSPALTVADVRLLMLYRYDAGIWLTRALSAILRRFTLPDILQERIRGLAP